jgi:hypothetical protein
VCVFAADIHSDVGVVRRVRWADFFGSTGGMAVTARQNYSRHRILSERARVIVLKKPHEQAFGYVKWIVSSVDES